MARSSWKFNFINSNIYKNIFLNKFKSFKLIRLFCRSSSIPKILLKKSIYIYKGNIYAKIVFTKYHISYKAGEFAVTRKPFSFPLKNPKKIKR
jgi:ribosomal protein S19